MKVNNLKKQINGKKVLDDISFSLNPGDKIGLVGANGVGKSTLLKVLSNSIEKDSGKISLNDETIGYLKQEIPSEYGNNTIAEYIKKDTGVYDLEKKLHSLESNLNENNMEEYGNVLNVFLNMDGYSFDDNLNTILSGLKLNKDINQTISNLSGGEKIKVLLADLLMQNTNILLLDEPTNNLDLEAIEWLENTLKNSKKEMIIVSHDEVFLNNIVNKIFELENGKIKEYNMTYNNYLIEKKHEYEVLKLEYEKNQEEKLKLKKEIQKAKEWVNKGENKKAHNDNDKIANNFAKERTKSSNVSKLTDKLKKMNDTKFIEKEPIDVFFSIDEDNGNKDIILENLICGYDNFQTPIINLTIPFGTKLNIVGGNGSGKTTLIKTILKRLEPKQGSVLIGSSAKIGYISQNTLENNSDETVIEYLTKNINNVDSSFVYTLLSKFNISYDERNRMYKTLSPGERTRVNLVKLALNKTNILILDEVTNHLDKDALDLIYELAHTYRGTIISISHNRKYNEILNPNLILDIKTGKVKYSDKLNSHTKTLK